MVTKFEVAQIIVDVMQMLPEHKAAEQIFRSRKIFDVNPG